jgi:branched-chain amino acid aminotransferase
MIVYLNGEFLPQDQARVSIFDRGLLYGDGLFETMRVLNGRPFRWDLHLQRLEAGAALLGIRLPVPAAALRSAVEELVRRNALPDALMRLTVTRGCGPRGYSPRGAEHPTVTMTLHPVPAADARACLRWNLVTSEVRLPSRERLAYYKSCNKLPQILARAQADAVGAQEALLLNTDGFVVEASSANLFWVMDRTVHTAPLEGGVLAGVTRQVVLESCVALSIPVRESCVTVRELQQAQGVFLSLSSVGLAAGATLDSVPLAQSPITEELHRHYHHVLERESFD